ncbi:MAG: hypothetical protein A7316_06350 [Candidatus Altiarchaeales archaeon WOR_SM1_86-2]|nr:MAG: hypothetical protein A7316_06350 [Candidatus Altiarchaeales archaeon WOR_SM1_86-2]ODS39948.1 MAG: hypothetical protein A7315_02715 [Candidatus Altiarchaeales archaeon WOR_SM1_79]
MAEAIVKKTFNEDLNEDKYIDEGRFLARLYFEAESNSKDFLLKALDHVVERLNKEQEVDLLEAHMYDLEKSGEDDEAEDEVEDEVKEEKGPGVEFYRGLVMIKLFVRDFRRFLSICMRYGPSVIELIEPREVELTFDQMQAVLTDVGEWSRTLADQVKLMDSLMNPETRAVYEQLLREEESCRVCK